MKNCLQLLTAILKPRILSTWLASCECLAMWSWPYWLPILPVWYVESRIASDWTSHRVDLTPIGTYFVSSNCCLSYNGLPSGFAIDNFVKVPALPVSSRLSLFSNLLTFAPCPFSARIFVYSASWVFTWYSCWFIGLLGSWEIPYRFLFWKKRI